MFCKNCGNAMDENANFCPHCGTVQKKGNNKDENSSNAGAIFVFFLAIGIAFLACFYFFSKEYQSCAGSSNTNNQKLFSRAAKNSDVEIDFSYPSLTSVCITIRPYHDIDNLQVTIKYVNSKGDVISTETKTIGNVKEGNEYNTYLNIFEMPSATDKYSVGVSGGTVSYLQ